MHQAPAPLLPPSAGNDSVNNSDTCQRYNEPTSSDPSPRTDQSLPPQASQACKRIQIRVLNNRVKHVKVFHIDREDLGD
mgnify:FL=1